MKRYVFFYHYYYKAKKAMSVHFKGACHVVDEVICYAPCRTKWNNKQPKLVMKGLAREVVFTETSEGRKYAVIT